MGDNALIYIGDPSHLRDGTINCVHHGIRGAFIGKDEIFNHVGLTHACNHNDNPMWV